MGKDKPIEIKYTVKEMFAKIDTKLDRIEEQTTKHNGRMSRLEGNPMVKAGFWIAENPFKSILIAIVVGIALNTWFNIDVQGPVVMFFRGLLL